MASTSTSEVKIDDVHGEIDVWSIGKCVICNMQLTGKLKILDCLHFICKDCIVKENSDSDIGVKCKCLTVTKGQLIDYPIESSYLSINKDHNPNVMMTYPILEEFSVCPICANTYADVFCTQCSILLCQFCHLHSHHNHNYKVLEKFCKEINSNVLLEKFKLESNNKNLDFSLEEIEKQIENFKIVKTAIYKEIDKETEILHKEINKRAFELKYLVDNCFLDTIGETYKNKETFKNLQKKNKYYIEITKSVLSHNNLSDILNVSRFILTKLENINNNTKNTSEMTSKFEIDLKNNFDETMNNCISTIKELGNIIASPILNLPKTNSINTPKNVCQTFVNLQTQSFKHPKTKFPFQSTEEEVHTINQLNMDTENVDSKPLVYVKCSCCLQLADELIQCVRCERRYHHHCHVPTVPEDVPTQILWLCTMCEDFKLSKALELHKSMASGVTIGEPGRTIIERILMELFCESHYSVHFRECPSVGIYPTFYEKMSSPINLNMIKNRLESNTYYKTLAHIINDIKEVFINALIFNHPTNEYYSSACILQDSLDTMITNWVPELNTKKK